MDDLRVVTYRGKSGCEIVRVEPGGGLLGPTQIGCHDRARNVVYRGDTDATGFLACDHCLSLLRESLDIASEALEGVFT